MKPLFRFYFSFLLLVFAQSGFSQNSELPVLHDSIHAFLQHVEDDTNHSKEIIKAGKLLQEIKSSHAFYYYLQGLRLKNCLVFYGYEEKETARAFEAEAKNYLLDEISYASLPANFPLIAEVSHRLRICGFNEATLALDRSVDSIIGRSIQKPWQGQWPVLGMLLQEYRDEGDKRVYGSIAHYLKTRYKSLKAPTPFEKFNRGLVEGYHYLAMKWGWNSLLVKDTSKNQIEEANRLIIRLYESRTLVDSLSYKSSTHNPPLVFNYLRTQELVNQVMAEIFPRNGHLSHVIYIIKDFVEEDLAYKHLSVPHENGFPVVIDMIWLVRQYRILADLFHEAGNFEDALDYANEGLDYYNIISVNDPAVSPYEEVLLKEMRLISLMRTGDSLAVAEQLSDLKQIFEEPSGKDTAHAHYWANHLYHHVMGLRYKAIKWGQFNFDSLGLLIDISINRVNEIEFPFTVLFSELYYTAAFYLNQQGKKKEAIGFLTDVLDENPRGIYARRLRPEIIMLYLQLQLQLGVAPDTAYLAELLDFSEKIITSSFPGLHPEERLRTFRGNLQTAFNLYHSLLAGKLVENYHGIKNRIIDQSLVLKKALSDKYLVDKAEMQKGLRIFFKEMDMEDVNRLRNKSYKEYELDKFLATSGENNFHTLKDVFQRAVNLTLVHYMPPFKLPDHNEMFNAVDSNVSLVEFIRYNDLSKDSAANYFAYVYNGTSKALDIVWLFTEKELTDSINSKNAGTQYKEIRSRQRSNILNKNSKIGVHRSATDPVAELVFRKIGPCIEGMSSLSVIPDGTLNLLSFPAMLWKKKFLFEHFTLKQLSYAYVAGEKTTGPASGNSMLAIGGIDYGKPGNGSALFTKGTSWENLPATATEIRDIENLAEQYDWSVRSLTGSDVKESDFDSLTRYKCIHIATHGYYFSSDDVRKYYHAAFRHPNIHADPNFRSGILLSNANLQHDSSSLAEGINGVLHGYELANTDLSVSELVVLSACETALGDIENNLGVTGLQRALKIAGAKQVLVSLWQIPDKETAEFMQIFYTNYFRSGDAARSLNETQKKMSSKYSSYYWGAFVLIE